MIVRIGGEGQFELTDEKARSLDALDTTLTRAFEERNDHAFHHALNDVVAFVRTHGSPVEAGRLVTSDVIIPPADITIAEAERYFSEEGLMQPLS